MQSSLGAVVFLVFPLYYGEFLVTLLEAHVHMHRVVNFKGKHAVLCQVNWQVYEISSLRIFK